MQETMCGVVRHVWGLGRGVGWVGVVRFSTDLYASLRWEGGREGADFNKKIC